MSPWKCPHCGTHQAESARCWACSRSPVTCSTCKDFRRSIAGRLGYCAADKRRTVLTGDEMRECWQAPATVQQPFLGLFGSLEPEPAPRPPTPAPVPASAPVAPTAAVAAQRRWNEIVAGSGVEDHVTVAATPPRPPAGPAPDPIPWRHPSIDEGQVAASPVIADEPSPRRPSALELLPATLANRLRRHGGTRGWRAIPVEGDMSRPSPMPPAEHGTGPSARARPVGPGRLVDAPRVLPGGMPTLGDQLRRAEQIRRERGLLDDQRLRRGRSDPGA